MKFKRVVLKLGTNVVMENESMAKKRLEHVVEFCSKLKEQGAEVLIVSSGAVGLGRKKLALKGKLTLPQKQASAAVGQNLLMESYQKLFDHYQQTIAQVLVTAHDFSDRSRYLNLKETLETLLEMNVIPILNENDSVSTVELREDSKSKSFGDNDRLASLVASKMNANLLIVMTDVEGVFHENPKKNKTAERIKVVRDFDELNQIDKEGQSEHGRGGMAAKVEAARIAVLSGVPVLITSGFDPENINQLFKCKEIEDLGEIGTIMLPNLKLGGRKRWIGFVSGYSGVICINEGAAKALIEKKASLLATGVIDIKGDFKAKEVVMIQNERGEEVARGLVNFSSEELVLIKGQKSAKIAETLGRKAPSEVIHRDHLVVLEVSE